MKERINWIDWAKAWCMTVVVFDHTPHDSSPFLLQFLAATNLSAFFFISGYLKKQITSQKEAIRKYIYCLILPYFIYNAIFYPYWLVKTYIEKNGILSIADYIKPVVGTFLGQLNSSFSCELNGVTWFLISLFFIHLITDFCNCQKHKNMWMLSISIIAMLLYGVNKYYHFAPYLPFHGLVRCICFFFMGNLFRHAGSLRLVCIKKDLTIGLMALSTSLTFFYWHICEDIFIIHILLFYLVNFFSIFAIIHLWRCADSVQSKVATYISVGTMVIFGLHRIIIGIIDYAIETSLHIQDIKYNWYVSIIITIIIVMALLPIILWGGGNTPILLGKKKRISF